ncbi:AAA family ATPase [Acidobacterium sp. S8]|uniref:AAA family ATPase n=1 Tax=Acidobacterium sp. S8 TaxID=1641854 RepID=UPI00131B2A44|nr:AAA family ATPase [Acidobacterium sp. S8]
MNQIFKPTRRNPIAVWILLAGLPATGKSTLAKALAAKLNAATILDKDRVRDSLFPGPMTDYTAEQDALCMHAMIDAAAYLTQHRRGEYIFFDGRTFSRNAQIEEVITAAEKSGAPWRILLLTCSDEAAESRLRIADSNHPARNRDFDLYLRVKAAFEPILGDKLELDTTESVDSLLPAALRFITAV